MRIGLTNPTTWPWVRRGAERFLNELAIYLSQRGHEVTVISGKPGRTQIRDDSGYTTICHRQLWHPLFAKAGIRESHAFFPVLLRDLLKRRFDVVLCCAFLDAYAAILARQVTRVPCVFWVNSLPPRIRYVREISVGGGFFRKVVREADEMIVLSAYMQRWFLQRHGRECVQLPVPVDTEQFPLSTSRDHERPVILCASALDDARKGGRALVQAFDQIKRRRPAARLQVSATVSAAKRAELMELVSPEFRADVQFLGAGDVKDLPRRFGSAAISVLPSLWESFGMVVVESMAAGTPVVGTRDGALTELIHDPSLGRLFDAGENCAVEPTNVDGLARAMEECLDLSRKPETAHRCRAEAETYSWPEVGPKFEEIFERLAERKSRRASVA
ncbi:MAG TPA: glycosyltransferase family 4 protein [Bryobacteraceae bacterium]|nr:glycosyltransferase family 4 protein [Bryobacteraceae bacterium]